MWGRRPREKIERERRKAEAAAVQAEKIGQQLEQVRAQRSLVTAVSGRITKHIEYNGFNEALRELFEGKP